MARAMLDDVVIAESDEGVVVEGNYYFPPASIRREYLKESTTHTTCPWKGEASYYHVAIPGRVAEDAAWYYPSPKSAAAEIKDHLAFWKGVTVQR